MLGFVIKMKYTAIFLRMLLGPGKGNYFSKEGLSAGLFDRVGFTPSSRYLGTFDVLLVFVFVFLGSCFGN